MEATKIAEYALLLVAALRHLVSLRMDIRPALDAAEAKMKNWVETGTDPTKADFDELNAAQAPKEDRIRASAQSDDGA